MACRLSITLDGLLGDRWLVRGSIYDPEFKLRGGPLAFL